MTLVGKNQSRPRTATLGKEEWQSFYVFEYIIFIISFTHFSQSETPFQVDASRYWAGIRNGHSSYLPQNGND